MIWTLKNAANWFAKSERSSWELTQSKSSTVKTQQSPSTALSPCLTLCSWWTFSWLLLSLWATPSLECYSSKLMKAKSKLMETKTKLTATISQRKVSPNFLNRKTLSTNVAEILCRRWTQPWFTTKKTSVISRPAAFTTRVRSSILKVSLLKSLNPTIVFINPLATVSIQHPSRLLLQPQQRNLKRKTSWRSTSPMSLWNEEALARRQENAFHVIAATSRRRSQFANHSTKRRHKQLESLTLEKTCHPPRLNFEFNFFCLEINVESKNVHHKVLKLTQPNRSFAISHIPFSILHATCAIQLEESEN